MLRWFAVVTCCAVTCAAADQLSPEQILLARVRVIMSQNLSSLPNYTCLQTIERTARIPSMKHYELIDRIRLEVALVNGRELFSWPGAGKFEDTEISQMVSGGAIGTGVFAMHAKALFQTQAPRFTFMGEQTFNERSVYRWDFSVGRERSGYVVRTSKGDEKREATVPYYGTIWADKNTLDLVRMETFADQIPPELELLKVSDSVDYARAGIGGKDFLLPTEASLTMTSAVRSESRNYTKFNSCRQYSGESVLRFDDAPDESAPKLESRTIEAPAGLDLDIELQTPLNLADAAVGDPLTGVLKRQVKLGSGLVAPKGALVHGRITFLRRQAIARDSGFLVGMDLHELTWQNMHAKLHAELDTVLSLERRPTLGSSLRSQQLRASMLRDLNIPGSVFVVQGYTLKLDRGLRMFWRTVAPKPESK